MSIKYSFILPTFNRLELLKETIKSLQNQNFSKDKFEIIVIDDNSIDWTEEYLKTKENNLIYFKNDINKGVWFNRNMWIDLSNWEIIIQTEDDAKYPENYLSEIDKKINELWNINWWTLIVLPRKTWNFDNWIIPKLVEFRRISIDKLTIEWKRWVVWWWIYKKDLYNILWWYKKLKIWEDVELVERIKHNWYSILPIFSTFWYHYEPDSFFKFFKRMYKQWYYYKEYKEEFKPKISIVWKFFWLWILFIPAFLIIYFLLFNIFFIFYFFLIIYIFLLVLTFLNQETRLSYYYILISKYFYLSIFNPIYYWIEIYWILFWRLFRSLKEWKNFIY